MTSFTWNAVCEHSLLFMQNMPYGLFGMQQGNLILKLVFCIINKLDRIFSFLYKSYTNTLRTY